MFTITGGTVSSVKWQNKNDANLVAGSLTSVGLTEQDGVAEEFEGLVSSLEDIPGFRGTRATAVQDNQAFWKRVLTAYGTRACREFNSHESTQHRIRMSRIKSAPVAMTNTGIQGNSKLLPRRCVSGECVFLPQGTHVILLLLMKPL